MTHLKKIRILICIFTVILWDIDELKAQSQAESLVSEFLADTALAGTSAGICFVDLPSGNEVLGLNNDLLLLPASTLKLVTTATALELLGPDFRFKTIMGLTGYSGSKKRTLHGNVVVKGGGDPTLGSSWLREKNEVLDLFNPMIRTLKSMGIKRVNGNIVVDVSACENRDIPGTWAWGDLGNYYGAVPSAATFMDNMVKLSFDAPENPGESVKLVSVYPEIEDVVWKIELKSSDSKVDLSSVEGSPWDKFRVVEGTIPAGSKNYIVNASMPDPPVVLGNFLKKKLSESGIKVRGNVLVEDTTIRFYAVDTIFSPPLAEIIRPLNHESINLFAEHLVLQLAFENAGKGSLDKGLEIMDDFRKEHGILNRFIQEDGSGLSRRNAISAGALVQILQYMKQSQYKDLFIESLPVAGEGTLRSFSKEDFPGETLQCKSGSMTRVRCYAGYLKCLSGRELAFAILLNNFPCSQQEMVKKIQKLLFKVRSKF
jgi:serine-type D-Ala-D-Ala carboxypeptidase/endopeptidase (penicillin-binding protein 4)